MRPIRKVICFRGRAGDRAEGNIPGAIRLAEHLANLTGFPVEWIGEPATPARDSWREALDAARPALDELASCVREEIAAGFTPFCVLPTDGSSFAVHATVIQGDADTTLVWFDAHADFNTPQTTQSGFLGGMALAASCGLWDAGFGRATSPGQVLLVGAREIDDLEQQLLRQHNVARIQSSREAPSRFEHAELRTNTFVHLDLDCLEPGYVPVQYEELGGLLPGEVRLCLEAIVRRSNVTGVTISEFYGAMDAAQDSGALDRISEMLDPLLSP